MKSVSRWYHPQSLENLPAEKGASPGFRFAFRAPSHRVLLYVTHRMTLEVDGHRLEKDRLSLVVRGQRARAADLPQTDWALIRGDYIEVIADFPGGLGGGLHRVRLEALFGGSYGGAQPGAVTLCEFEDQCRQLPPANPS